MKKTTIIITVLAISFLFLLTACQNTNSNTNNCSTSLTGTCEEKTINVNEFKTMIDKENPLIIDIRTPEEYNEGHIEDAININFYESNFFEEIKKIETDQNILIYCRSGHRSGLAMKGLKGEMTTNLYDLEGGILSWEEAKYNLVSSGTESKYNY